MTHAEEAPLYNKLPENEKQYALFTDGSCVKVLEVEGCCMEATKQVTKAAEGEGESSQFAVMKDIQLALDIADQEK